MINGVNVSITMSFEVKIVKNEINKYKIKNSLNWLVLYLLIKIDAMYPKNPLVSSTIEINDTEINKINILTGFNFELDVSISINSFLSNKGKTNRMIAISKTGK